MTPPQTTIETFLALDIRAATILTAEAFPEARKSAYKLTVDCGPEIGIKHSSAQITELYEPGDLPGRRVAAAVNLPPRRIGPVVSEILVLGFPDPQGRVVLVEPAACVPDGARLY